MVELKHLRTCPMCGGHDLYIEPDEYGSGGQWVQPVHVGCKPCRLELVIDDIDCAIAAWNRRQPSTPPASPVPASVRAAILEEAAKACEDISAYNEYDPGSTFAAAIRALAEVVPEQRGDSTEVCSVKEMLRDDIGPADFGVPIEYVDCARNFANWLISEQGRTDAVDGERYRWLRRANNGVCVCVDDSVPHTEELDSAIDRAIAAESAAQGAHSAEGGSDGQS